MLVSGMFAYGPASIAILLCNGMPKQEARTTMWHEVVHMLKRIKGPSTQPLEELEREVEAAAQKLAVACPEILEWCGIDHLFKDEHPVA